MDLPEEDRAFLRDLVKTSRQRSVHFEWQDRDGTGRFTVLGSVDATRLHGLAHRLGVSPAETLRQAAFVPVAKPTIKPAS